MPIEEGSGTAPSAGYSSPVECPKGQYCLTNQPCDGASGCQIFNCRENGGVYRCTPPSGECKSSDLTDDDRCLYSKSCDPAFQDCTVKSCALVKDLDAQFKEQLEDLELDKYDSVCVPPERIDPSPVPTDGPAPGLPCQSGFDDEGHFTTDPKEISFCKSVATGLGINIGTDPAGLIQSVFSLILSLAGGIALLLIIYSGFQLVTSQGNPEKLEAARQQLVSAIVGLLFIIFSLVILQIIGVDILRIPDFNP